MADITAKMVAELRAKTGAGLMDCKKALTETDADFDAAVDYLRKKGVATAAKKAGRDASDGLIETYIHTGGKVGVMLEINCETDFVAKNEEFKAFARDICLHIAASAPTCVSREEVPEADIEKEKEIATAQAEGKPAQAIQKIVEGKLSKYYSQVCLMEQPFVKDPEQTIKDLLTAKIAATGENLIIRRFARFAVGE
jgi:elongation factor Ts